MKFILQTSAFIVCMIGGSSVKEIMSMPSGNLVQNIIIISGIIYTSSMTVVGLNIFSEEIKLISEVVEGKGSVSSDKNRALAPVKIDYYAKRLDELMNL